MKKEFSLLFVLLFLFNFQVKAQYFQAKAEGVIFFSGTWQEALSKAKKENKPIFVEFYTEWCGYCKEMEKNVFTKDNVINYYNNNFVNLKMDAEQGEGIILAKEFQVGAYPTQVIVNSEGALIKKSVGYKGPIRLIQFGKSVINPNPSYDYAAMQREYKTGNRDPGFVQLYIEKSYLKAAELPVSDARTKLYADIREIAENYILSQSVSRLINPRDFEIIQRLQYPELGEEVYQILIDNYEAFAKVVPESELASLVIGRNTSVASKLARNGDKEYKKYLGILFNKLQRPIKLKINEDPDNYILTYDKYVLTRLFDMVYAFSQDDIKNATAIGTELLNYKVASDKDQIVKVNLVAYNIAEHKDALEKDFVFEVLRKAKKAAELQLPLVDMLSVRFKLAELNAMVEREEAAIEILNKLKEDIEAYKHTDIKKTYWIPLIEKKLQEIENNPNMEQNPGY